MTLLKWSIIVFLGGITLLGLPIRAESESSTEDIKPSSAKECRVHIEKALEQYWDQKAPSGEENAGMELSTDKQDNEDEEYEIKTESELADESQELDLEDNEEDEEEEDDDEEIPNETEKNVSGTDDTDEQEDDEDENAEESDTEDDDDDDENDTESLETDAEEEKVVDEEDDEDEDDDEIEENSEEKDLSEEEKTKVSESPEESTSNDANEAEEEEEEETEEDEEEETEEVEEAEEEDEDEADNEETEEQVEEEEEEVEDDDEEEESEEGENKDNLSEDIQKTAESDPPLDEVKIEIQIEGDKVTGEANRSSDRVEFLDKKLPSDQPQASQVEEKNVTLTVQEDTDSEDDDTEDDEPGSEIIDDSIENIYEEEDDAESTSGVTYRSRDHIDVILGLDEIGTEYDKEEEKMAQNIFKEIKKIHQTQIKPMEMLYKYTDSTTRILGDAEIHNKPMLIFLGPWSAGKTSIINYLLGIERTPAALKTGTGVTDVDFTVITYGDQKRIISGTELAADWRYAGVQKFGQGFLDHFRGIEMQHTLLKKITIIDTPGVLENKKNAERGYSLNDAFQWFVDRSDAIYVVLDPTKVDIGSELGSVIDQLKGKDARFILNKADSIRRSDLMRIVGQLFWNLSPLMSSTEAPVIYAVSLTTKPYHPSAPAKFLADQEKNFLYDMKDTLDKRVENRILYARRHAVRVRNHAKMIDCYLATYYRHKSIFSSKRNVAKLITENPRDYNIFDGLGDMKNVSRYDLPDPIAYKEFFKLHPLYDFKPLASTCSYFRGCPMEKLDLAISKNIPELLAKYKKMKLTDSPKQGR